MHKTPISKEVSEETLLAYTKRRVEEVTREEAEQSDNANRVEERGGHAAHYREMALGLRERRQELFHMAEHFNVLTPVYVHFEKVRADIKENRG